jgi:hypothetical protein
VIAYHSRDGYGACTRNREVGYGEKFFARLGYPEQTAVGRIWRSRLHSPLGSLVGYQSRFGSCMSLRLFREAQSRVAVTVPAVAATRTVVAT